MGRWKPDEVQFIRDNSDKMTDKQIWEKFTGEGAIHTYSSLVKYRQRLGMKKSGGRSKKNITGLVQNTVENLQDSINTSIRELVETINQNPSN